MRILLLDIETAPNTAYVWGLFKQNISISQIVDSSAMLCWSAKWLGEDSVFFKSILDGKKKMLTTIHKLLEEADVVIHYNGSRFDIPTLNKEFLEAKMPPPSPFAQVDLLKTARQRFRFPSNKLDYVGKALGLGSKVKHEGFELWIKCMQKDKDAWERMKEYNIQDVVLLERVYERFLPWIKGHPNKAVHNEQGHSCPTCGSEHVQKRGFALSQAGKYQRYQCQECGTWSRERTSVKMPSLVLTGA
jgi:DNA polymerase elongation subunit (family B)/predicted RNA-binding Zn-ribbon protein involved in translation (DUF1610 family)